MYPSRTIPIVIKTISFSDLRAHLDIVQFQLHWLVCSRGNLVNPWPSAHFGPKLMFCDGKVQYNVHESDACPLV